MKTLSNQVCNALCQSCDELIMHQRYRVKVLVIDSHREAFHLVPVPMVKTVHANLTTYGPDIEQLKRYVLDDAWVTLLSQEDSVFCNARIHGAGARLVNPTDALPSNVRGFTISHLPEFKQCNDAYLGIGQCAIWTLRTYRSQTDRDVYYAFCETPTTYGFTATQKHIIAHTTFQNPTTP